MNGTEEDEMFFRYLLTNPRIIIGLVFLAGLCSLAVFAPYITRFDPTRISPKDALKPPNPLHWFGTDNMGRDVYSRVIYGTRYSLTLGLLATVVSAFFGLSLGLFAGYAGGVLDMLIMRLVDVGLAFPSILLALLIIAVLGPGLPTLALAIGVSSIPPFVRLVRASVLYVKEMPFVEAARAIGASDGRIMFRHILPEVFAPALTMGTLRLANAIFVASSLSFVGLGARPPIPEWGAMVSMARHQLRIAWWVSTFPGLAIFFTVLAINLLGDGLRDALDPKLRGKL
ncbi:MAG: ABC transporter permease [Candidatus Methanomethylicaceae archaeon]